MTILLQCLFWISVAGVLYTYVGYPVLIRFLARVFAQPVRKASSQTRCAVVIAAYNEVNTLPAKLRALLDSPNADRITEIWVGSDGSDDGTGDAVRALGDARIQLIEFKARRGKPSVLNDIIPKCSSNLIVLTDARQELAPDALEQLLANFSDECVGVVSGELIFRDPDAGSSTAVGMDFYWRYEKGIRRAEGQFRSVPGATGALYAIRRELFEPLPPDILLDDVAIPMGAVLKGARCVFESDAVVFDVPSRSGKAEETRKRRTIAGNVQLAQAYPSLLLPWRNPIWFEFVSHKMLRLTSPLLLVLMLVANILLWPVPLYVALLPFHLGFYALALVGLTDVQGHKRPIWLTAPGMFLRLNLTTVHAWRDVMRKRYRVHWERTA